MFENAYPESEKTPDEQRLEVLTEQEAELRSGGHDTTFLQETIRELKREQRELPTAREGDLLAGRFKLVELLGEGGFARVWKALDRDTADMVAVKIIHPQYAENNTRLTRFFRGAREMAKLKHPRIVRVLAAKPRDRRHAFFVMEYLAGGDFRRAVLDGKLSLEERMAVIPEVGEALHHAHEKGVIHRDVKPGFFVERVGIPGIPDKKR